MSFKARRAPFAHDQPATGRDEDRDEQHEDQLRDAPERMIDDALRRRFRVMSDRVDAVAR